MSHVISVREGDLIGEYRLVRLLGAGGMGAVFEAVHETIGKRAAIKFLILDGKQHPEFEQRFISEARATSEIQHPGVVQIFGFGRHTTGTMWMLMELLAGETLFARLTALQKTPAQRLPRSTALTLGRQLASALTAAHARGIVHRDLKPGNVMLVADHESAIGERIKLLDFGIAKLMTDSLRGQGPGGAPALKTATGSMMGTPAYMAPEQCLSAAHVDDKADVYALGVLLYEMLVGRLPFAAEHPLQVMADKNERPAPSITEYDPSLPDDVALLAMRMLERDPSPRPSMADTHLALCRILGVEPSKHSGYHFTVPESQGAIGQLAGALAAEERPTVDAPPDFVAPALAIPPRVTEDLGPRAAVVLEPLAAPVPAASEDHATTPAPKPRWPWAVLLIILLGGGSAALMRWSLPSSIGRAFDMAKPQDLSAALDLAAPADLYASLDSAPVEEITGAVDLSTPSPPEVAPELLAQPAQPGTAAGATHPGALGNRPTARSICPAPTRACIMSTRVPTAQAEIVVYALKKADIRLCLNQSISVVYRQNAYRQEILSVAAPPPLGVPAQKLDYFLRILDGKLPPGQRLATPIVIRCTGAAKPQ